MRKDKCPDSREKNIILNCGSVKCRKDPAGGEDGQEAGTETVLR